MNQFLVNVGFGNFVAAQHIVAAVAPTSAPVKRMVQEGREAGLVVDATCGRKTRAVIVMQSGQIVLAAVQPETVANRLRETMVTEE